MMHFTTPKKDKARAHLQRMNIAIDELLSTREHGVPWLACKQERLKVLYERRDTAVRYMRRFSR